MLKLSQWLDPTLKRAERDERRLINWTNQNLRHEAKETEGWQQTQPRMACDDDNDDDDDDDNDGDDDDDDDDNNDGDDDNDHGDDDDDEYQMPWFNRTIVFE